MAKGADTCDDCAFKLGTTPNQCPTTLLDVIKCVMEGEPFLCHKNGKACGGWVHSQKELAE